MNVQSISPGEAIGARRGDAVVCIGGRAGREQFATCLRSVLAHTPAGVPIVVCKTAVPESDLRQVTVEGAPPDGRAVLYLGSGQSGSAEQSVSAAARIAAPADIVVLDADCVVADGWLAGLREAAYSDSRVAIATSLGNDGVLATALRQSGLSFGEAAAAIRTESVRIRPRVMSAGGPCMYVRRSALELVGDVDLEPVPAPNGPLDFARRCIHAGLSLVVADDVLVARESPNAAAVEPAPETIGPLARSLGAARRALTGLSVAIDARILVGPTNGTTVHTLELIAAVARTGRARVTAIVGPDLSSDARSALETLPGVVLTTVTPERVRAPAARADLVHRPFQVSAPADLAFLSRFADRLVITQQDLISYHNPSYFRSAEAWTGYRELTRAALAAADRVLFFSGYVRDDALGEELLEPNRASVVPIGVDHVVAPVDADLAVRPQGAELLPADTDMILCLGTDFLHKNRVFALRLLDQLQRLRGWSGWLVLAGPHVAFGSSGPEEEQFLRDRPELAGTLLRLGAVSEPEKRWLLERAKLVVYPTVHEGFGLVPFEAADHGVPCLWAAGTALSEVLPDSAAGIVAWDASASAQRALEMIRDPAAAAATLQAVHTAGESLRWDLTADRLIDLYRSVCDQPSAPAGAIQRTRGLMQSGLSDDAVRLVGPNGVLASDLERPLLALATHPRIGSPVLGAIRAGYQIAHRRRRTGPSK